MNDEINLIEYIHLIRKKLWLILLIVFVITSVSIIYSLSLPSIYRSEAIILPLGSSSSVSNLAAITSQLSGFGMLGNSGNTSFPKLIVLLTSWSLAEKMIKDMDLLKVFFKDQWDGAKQQWKQGKPPSMEGAVAQLKSMISFSEDKRSSTMTIFALSEDPQFAKKMADQVLVELQSLIAEKQLSESKRRRVFIEQRLGISKKELLEMGKGLTQVYKGDKISPQLGLVDVSVDADAMNDTVLPQLTDTLADLDQKKEKLDEVLKNSLIVRNIPQQVYMDYLNQKRQVLVAIVGLLSQEYEMAKMEEAREDISFQVIDAPRVSEKRFKPQRKKIVTKAFGLSFLIALFYVLGRDYFDKMRKTGRTV